MKKYSNLIKLVIAINIFLECRSGINDIITLNQGMKANLVTTGNNFINMIEEFH